MGTGKARGQAGAHSLFARVTESVDVADLNSAAPMGRVGSNPTPGTWVRFFDYRSRLGRLFGQESKQGEPPMSRLT